MLKRAPIFNFFKFFVLNEMLGHATSGKLLVKIGQFFSLTRERLKISRQMLIAVHAL